MNKSELKSKYKDLVRVGKSKEALAILRKIHSFKPIDSNVKVEKKQSKKKLIKEESSDLDELISIKGIGAETISDLKRIYSSKKDLKKDLKLNKVPLRNDIVKILKKKLK